MGKRKFILIASVIFVIGFGYCLYSTGKSYIPEGLPVEEMVTEAHYFIPDGKELSDFIHDAEDLPVEENLPEEKIEKRKSAEEDYTEVRFIYMPD